MSNYEATRSSIASSGVDSRVEVNQRALIDKILARYASEGAVYRELIQNSNDAEAGTAEIRITTVDTPNHPLVTQVVYRNDGHSFRPQDWDRLRKIAEGNPDVSKIGAFGVGAYTMFSICDQPLVISGNQALSFVWKGDALWTKVAPSQTPQDQWTTFVLPSRDPYPLPNLVEFGQFLCTSLTFTQCLHTITVFVNEEERLTISKQQLQSPRVMSPPKSSSWWSNDGAVTQSPKGIFSLGRADGSITETVFKMLVTLDGETSSSTARYVSAQANVRVPRDIAKGMYRVTKKNPPSVVNIQIFIDAASPSVKRKLSRAGAILDKFSPSMGNGGVFIGFKTSQTTGLAAHLAAPLVPTVEREAIDFQDPNLREFNSELLSIAGILMRLTLEHSMSLIGKRWEETREDREAFNRKPNDISKSSKDSSMKTQAEGSNPSDPMAEMKSSKGKTALSNFASFMSSGVRKIADVISSVDLRANDYDNLLNPEDPRPLSQEEEEAVLLMRSFCPQHSTPDRRVGSLIAGGFSACMPKVSPPVLSNSGVVRSSESRLPFHGIERFVTEGVVRKKVQQRADEYLQHVAGCKPLTLNDLELALQKHPLSEGELIIFLKWWTKFCRVEPAAIGRGSVIKKMITWSRTEVSEGIDEKKGAFASLESFQYFRDEDRFSSVLPFPATLLPQSIQEKVTQSVLTDKSLNSWFLPLPFRVWASFISTHSCLTAGRHDDSHIRLLVLAVLSKEHSSRSEQKRLSYERWLHSSLSDKRCIPYHSYAPEPLATECPSDLYLSSAEITIFEGLGSFRKASPALQKAGISDEFLIALGVRKTISIDFLFTQLDNLKWDGDPKPLIEYLCGATLTAQDLDKLKSTKYLPAYNDSSSAYAPSQLHFPNPELEVFPFVKILHWPSLDGLSERSREGRFLKQLGCRRDPELREILTHLTSREMDNSTGFAMLSFVNERLKSGGCYHIEYRGTPDYREMKFLPAVRKDPLMAGASIPSLQAPINCYTDSEVSCMGFPVMHPSLQKKEGKTIGERFFCLRRPTPDQLAHQLLNIASFAKKKLSSLDKYDDQLSSSIEQSFSDIFDYLSTRTKEFHKDTVLMLRSAPFIPVRQDDKLHWFRPGELYFRNVNLDTAELTSTLFCVIDFNSFLAAIGLKSEPSLKDLFQLVISSPGLVLKKIGGEAKYRALLHRIAANPPFTKVTEEIRRSSFLLAYRAEGAITQESGNAHETHNQRSTYILARPEEIFVVDNTSFARMFNVLAAPPESDLEGLYISLGSNYLTKRVEVNYKLSKTLQENTALTTQIGNRIQERKPLLVFPRITSRQLKPNAEILLKEENITVYEASKLEVIYGFAGETRTRDITCFSRSSRKNQSMLYVSKDVDWFEVGAALAEIIFQRYHLEDSFLIESLLVAPLRKLRARGFPVDRILKNVEPMAHSSKPIQDMHSEAAGEDEDMDEQTTASRGLKAGEQASGSNAGAGYIDILTQMFPDCDLQYIRSLLGSGPTLEKLRQVADLLSDGNYPKKKNSKPTTPPNHPNIQDEKKRKFDQGGLANPVTRVLRGLKTGWRGKLPASNIPPTPVKDSVSQKSLEERLRASVKLPASNISPTPVKDSVSQKFLEERLRASVKSSQKINAAGIGDRPHFEEDQHISPDFCEAVPSENLGPCAGKHGTGQTENGIRMFFSRKEKNSEEYLYDNFDIAEAFSGVLQTLCEVYSLQLHSVAIYYAEAGKTIAFNAGGALYFNLRFFASLHWQNKLDEKPYIYWFTIMAHELAHNFGSMHDKKHGYYTESYVMLYLPKLLDVLR